MSEKKNSTNISRWSKFTANTLALLGLVFIIFVCIVAILGYLITPDKSPNANEQFLELSARKPMTEVTFLKLPEKSQQSQSFLKTMLYGKNPDYTAIPIDSFYIKSDKLIVFPIDKSKDLSDSLVFTANQLKFDKQVKTSEFAQYVNQKLISKKKFILGTDRMGRDLLSRLIIGARISLAVGFAAVVISLIIGIILGSVAGYYRGLIDSIVMWFINVSWSIPTLLLVISLSLVLKKGFLQIFVAIGLTMWVDVARIIRGLIISLREKEYIEACRAMGFSDFRIIARHIFPATIGPLVIISAANFASAILIESGLSFLGLGVQPPVPTWGSMIKEHYGYIILDKAYLAILPGLLIMLLTLAFTFVGNGLRDVFDSRSNLTNSGVA